LVYRLTVAVLVSLVCEGLLASPVSAQYFGRNKVRYEDLAFQVLQTPHFDIHYYPAEREAVRIAATLAERWYARLSIEFDHTFQGRQPLVLYASHSHFTQTTVVPNTIEEGTGGMTDHVRGRIVMPFAAGLRETEHVLGHELVHAFQRDMLRKRGRSLAPLPAWYVEGMAEYIAMGRIDAHTSMWIRDAVRIGRLPSLDELDDPQYFPYRYGQALWAFLSEAYGDEIAARSLRSMAKGGAIGRLVDVTGASAAELSAAWHRFLKDHAAATTPAGSRVPGPLLSARGTRLNLAPALSPDGSQIVFLSGRGQYSIDVYLADAYSGAITRRLIATAADPHFDSLQFIASAGAWDPGGRRFAMIAVRRGRPVLTILDLQTAKTWREIELAGLDDAFTPAWSPDGGRLVFSGMRGGASDLHVVELETGELRALTRDGYAELHPSWSPDGRAIVFATDRFTSSIDEARFGDYRLALLEVSSRQVTALPALPAGKHVDPEFSADGRSVYFIADADGVSNVYRVVIETGEMFRITNTDTGVSGVTPLSPAMSLAPGARLAYSVYRDGAYTVHTVSDLAGTAVAATTGARSDTLAAGAGRVAPPLLVRPYSAGMRFDPGQPYVSAGDGTFDSYLTAGVSFSFGDTLGEHSVRTSVQAGTSLRDLALEGAYVNRQSRWNWQLAAQHVSAGVRLSNDVQRQQHQRFTGAVMYPLDRTRRMEVRGGVHTAALEATAPVTFGEAGAAFVYDNSLHGPTGPILGRRFRVDLSPAFGALNVTTVTGDYRQYFMPSPPLTLAVRARHLGRVGPDASDPRLLPLAHDLRDVARGFSGETHASPSSHVSQANVELRVPVPAAWRTSGTYGRVPLDAFLFADNAWLASRALQSAGAGVRVNTAGLVLEFAAARRFSGATGWAFAFNLIPAF
jgi:Tol biopolymer transport system component